MAVRNNIKNRISLEGADEVKRKFDSLGKAGKDAFKKIEQAGEEARGRALGRAFREAIDRAILKLKEFAAAARRSFNSLKGVGGALGGLGSSIARVGRNLALLGGAVAGAATGFAALVKQGTELIDTVGKAAQSTGLAIDEYGRLQYAAAQSGVQQADFNSSMVLFGKAVGEAANGSKRYQQEFARLGVSIRDANGAIRPTGELFVEAGAALARLGPGAQQASTGAIVFGRSFAKLIPLFNAGKSGIRALGAEAEKLGIIFTPEQFKQAENFNDQISRIVTQVRAVTAKALLPLAGIFEVLGKGLENFITASLPAIREFGLRLAINVGQAILDLFALFKGEDSKVVNTWLIDAREAFKTLYDDLKGAGGILKAAFEGITAVAQLVADAINKAFGTNVSANAVLISAAVLKLVGAFKVLGATLAVVRAGFGFFATLVPLITSLGGVLASFFGTSGVIATGFAVIKAIGAALLGLPGLIVAAIAAAGFLIYQYWDEISAAAQVAFDAIVQFAKEAWPNVVDAFFGIVEGIGKVWDKVKTSASSALSGIGGVAKAAATKAGQAFGVVSDFAGDAWDDLSGGAKDAFATVKDLFTDDDFQARFFQQLNSAGEEGWEEFKRLADVGWQEIVAAAELAKTNLTPIYEFLNSTGSSIFDGISSAAGKVWEGVVSTFESSRDFVVDLLKSIGSALASAWEASIEGIGAAADAISEAIKRATDIADNVSEADRIANALAEPFRKVRTEIEGIWEGIANFIQTEVRGIVSTVQSLISSLINELTRLQSQIRSARTEASRSSSSSGSSANFATGGIVRGPGTSTSDSIPAWLSNNEFVVRAAAVRKYGVAFLHAINSMRAPKQSRFATGGLVTKPRYQFKEGLPRFALGGLISSLASLSVAPPNALAPVGTGGAGGSLRPLSLTIGSETFSGLLAPEDTAQQMMKFAKAKAISSAGRKPGYYR